MRFFLLLLFPLMLASCYRPIYGGKDMDMQATQQETRLNRTAIAAIANEQGQILRNFLIDRMYGQGRPEKTDATLSITISQAEEDLGLQRDATTLRRKVTYTAAYTLTDNATHKLLYTGTSRTLVSYDKINAQYGAMVSRESAGKRAMRDLSDLIITQLLVYYGKKDNEPAL